MTLIRERFTLVNEPVNRPAPPSILKSGLEKSTAAIVTLSDRIDAGVLASAQKIKVIANYAVGYNNVDVEAARQRGIVVTNTPDVLTDATADLTWALILATARRVIEGDCLVRHGQWTGWTPTQLLGTAVAGRTLGIVGMGRIGQAVAHRAAGFRMKVCYTSRRPIESPPGIPPWESVPLPTLLTGSDIVTLHTPLTADTHHLIGAEQLALMRRTAIVVNTARGPIIDESALVAALADGTIAGAGLDVFEDEPRLHPRLTSFSQVVLLPHLGSATMTARVEMGLTCLKNIEAVLSGRPAPNQVT
ncbi:MAG TPA: D-glycerate dehydrogenase [Nitrospira sp.]|jgi:glyoxylate reductase|nr:D-glycerate dehydrogenase [Nitrospira sp.]